MSKRERREDFRFLVTHGFSSVRETPLHREKKKQYSAVKHVILVKIFV